MPSQMRQRDPAFIEVAQKQGMPLNYMDLEAIAKNLLRQQQAYGLIWKERESK